MSALKAQFEEDTRALVQFLNRRDPLPPSHVRIVACAIVRKWLIDNQIAALSREVGCTFTLPILDTSKIAQAIASGASVSFFMAGGVIMDGVPIRGFYFSEEPFEGSPKIPIDSMNYMDLPPKKFLKARRVYHMGEWFTTEQIIRFIANKYGGVHFDPTRDKLWQRNLENASEFFTVGNPNNLRESKVIETTSPKHKVLLVLPKEAGHLWTCLDIELLAVAQSLINIRCNGVPLIEFSRRPKKCSLSSVICRLKSGFARLLGRGRSSSAFR